MSIKTFTPKFKIEVRKSILRKAGVSQRYPGGNGESALIDVTPFIGEDGRVFTSKSIYQPMGAFTLAISDRPSPDKLDTLYGLIEPMDTIYIRMSHEPHKYVGKPLPIIMRGFVQSIVRQETMGDDGKPHRLVMISGRDYGLIFNMVQILNLKAYAEGKALLTGFSLWEKTGIAMQPRKPNEFMKDVIDKVINPFLKTFAEETENQPVAITAKATVTDGTIWPKQDYDGAIWGLMTQYADLPWNELFVRDTEEGVELVYRPVPFQDTAGEWIPQGSQEVKLPDTDIIPVGFHDVKSLEVTRSDQHVTNLFWVDHPSNGLVGGTQALRAATFQEKEKQNIYLEDEDKYPNCNPELYGARPMVLASRFAYPGLSTSAMDLPKDDQKKVQETMMDWINRRRTDLIALNKDNVVFEEGSMTIRGNEAVRPGCYIDIERGKFKGRYYVHSVNHTFIPYQQYVTQVQFIRGTGFLVRSKSDTPYTDEGKPGIYD